MRDGKDRKLIEFAGKPSVHSPILISQVLSQVLHLDRRLCKTKMKTSTLCCIFKAGSSFSWWRSVSHFVLTCGRLTFSFPSSCEQAQSYVLGLFCQEWMSCFQRKSFSTSTCSPCLLSSITSPWWAKPSKVTVCV